MVNSAEDLKKWSNLECLERPFCLSTMDFNTAKHKQTSQNGECKSFLLNRRCILKFQWLLKGTKHQSENWTQSIPWTPREELLQRQLMQLLTEVKWFYLYLQVGWAWRWNSVYCSHVSVFQIMLEIGKGEEGSWKKYLQAEETALHRKKN